jgi:AraC-type DNA-binding domain-containing proteins
MIIHKPQNTKKYNKENKSYFLDFINCGLIQAQKNWIHKKRFLEKYELIYVTEGNLYLQIDRNNRVLSKNDLIIIPPYKTISGTKESEIETSFFWVDFLTDNAENFGVISNLIHINQPDKINTLLEELRSISDQKNISDFTKDSFLLLLFHQIKKSVEQNSIQHMIIIKFCNYIENNITKPLTAQMVADALKYNKDYLCRVIKKYYGISLIDYINKQKINLAKKLLSTSNYSIKEISNYLGYDDSNLFTKYFKYHEKISPLQYRNSNTN